MNSFHSNIINIYGEKGEAWLDALPQLVSATSSKLDLRVLQEVTNLTYNYVLSGFQGDNLIILKVPGISFKSYFPNMEPELLHHADSPNIIQGRVTRFAAALELPECRIIDWCFVQAVLAWVWVLEDGSDTNYFEQLTKVFDEVVHASN